MPEKGINNTDIFKNTFSGGLNYDINIDLLQPNQYRDSLNIDIASDGEFFSVKNLKGTTEIETLFDNTVDPTVATGSDYEYNLLGVWAAYGFDTSDNTHPTLVIVDTFLDNPTGWIYKLRVSTKNVITGSFNTIFEKSFADGVKSPILWSAADAIIYSEAGKESIYFTDNFTGMYKVPILVDSATQYSEEEVTLIRKYPLVEQILLPSPTSGGSLKCGSYQFSIRYINKDLNKQTKWSLLSRPITVSNDVNASLDIKNSSIGGSSEKQIICDWPYDTTQAAEYDYAEIAIVEHIDGTKVPAQTATIVGPVTISSLVSGANLRYRHKSNSGTPYDLTEIVVDHAAIKAVESLAIKNNRMLLGGITYHDLSYDTAPSVDAANTNTIFKDQSLLTGAADDQHNSIYKGYFRGEVYRFAVTFHDEFGNWSEPQVLNFSAVADNYVAGGIDYKFAAREYGSGTWTNNGFLFEDGVGNDDIRAMGIKIGIDNIPSWAKGMVILRAKRIKKILAQTPVVPSILVQPAELTTGTADSYPIQYTDEDGNTQTDSDAQPPNPLGTLMPKNFSHNYAKSIVRDRKAIYTDVPDTACVYTGTALTPSPLDGSTDHYQTMFVHFLYPPELLYGDGNTKWDYLDDKQKYKLEFVDAVLLKCKEESEGYNSGTGEGNYVETNVHSSFYAIDKEQYYYHDAQTTDLGYTLDYEVIEIKHIPYADESTILSKPRKTSAGSVTNDLVITSSVMDYSSLQEETTLALDGYKPTSQEAFVCVIDTLVNDITKSSYSTTGTGYTNTVNWLTGKINAASYYNVHENFFRDGADTDNVSAVPIANITTTVDDYRYGDSTQYHEFYSTGTYKNVDGLTSTTVNVWGGDCFIGPFTFKLTDRTYSIPNAVNADSTSDTAAQLKSRWKRHYDQTSGGGELDVPRPTGVKGNSQTITVILESEISPSSIGYNNDTTGFTTTHPFLVPSSYSAVDINIPNNYSCNMSYNLGNELKIWIPIDNTDRQLTETKSRIAYSDQKVYNADIEGFDIYRALNFYDLDESFGGITKLITVGDNIYSIQENAYSYVPVDAQIIETADATSLSIRSGEVIGIPNYINTNNGSQHIKTVIQTGNVFYFFDYKNKVLVKNVGGQEEIISDKGLLDKFNDIAHDGLPKRGYQKNELVGIYDSKNRKYILTKRRYDDILYGDVDEFTYVYDEKLGIWVSRWNMEGATSVSIYGGVTDRYGELFLVGSEEGVANDIELSEMYTGSVGTFFGVQQPMYIDFVVNPVSDQPKTFDTLVINSDGPLTSINIDVPTPNGTYTTGAMSLAISDVENLYKLKTLRNTATVNGNTGQRLRGLYAEYHLIFPNTEQKLNSVLTRFRPSNRGL